MPLSTSSSDNRDPVFSAIALRTLVASITLSIVGIVGATEWLVRAQVAPQDTYANHLELLQTSTHSDAAFGDSHVARGFDAKGGFVNLAYPSENIDYMHWKMRTHFDTVAPGRVIVQADPHLFAAYRLNAPFTPYRNIAQNDAPVLQSMTTRHRPRLLAYWRAFFRGFGQLETTVQQTENGALLSQGDLSVVPPRKRQLEARTRIENHSLGPPDAVAAAQERYLEMISYLSAKGAQICLVSFPVSPDYLSALSDAQRRSEGPRHVSAIQFFQETAQHLGARYIDARRETQDLALFRDVDHFNIEGAQLFSVSLVHACFPE